MSTYGLARCDAYHGGLTPPFATVDWGQRVRIVGVPGKARYLCDQHARGLTGWRDRFRMADAPALDPLPSPAEPIEATS